MGRFEKIIGYEAVKEKLNIALDAMLDSRKYMKLGVTVPKGILLDGENNFNIKIVIYAAKFLVLMTIRTTKLRLTTSHAND